VASRLPPLYSTRAKRAARGDRPVPGTLQLEIDALWLRPLSDAQVQRLARTAQFAGWHRASGPPGGEVLTLAAFEGALAAMEPEVARRFASAEEFAAAGAGGGADVLLLAARVIEPRFQRSGSHELTLADRIKGGIKGGKRKAEPGETLASGKISKGTAQGKSEGGTASVEKQGGVLPGDSDAVKKEKKRDGAFGGQGVGPLQQSLRGERSHGGGGKRVGAGAKPGEGANKWKSLTKEKALALGLGWGACKKCGEKDKDGKDLTGAVSWNGSTRNPTRAARPSFVPTDMRFDRRHQCAACKGDFVVG